MTRAKLKPIDYSKSSMVDAFHRQEIRSLLRSMPEAQRIAAMKKYSFREAALETVAEVSGLPESVHEQLMQQTLREKFPDEIASTEAAAEGVEVCETALKAARAAVEAELLAVGEPIIEGPAPAPVKAWA